MQNRTPVPREARPALPDFTPVPRQKVRHDGWTPERQKAFIEALADTGSVTRAAAMVNMAQRNCYFLRRQPGAEEFRRAWDAALDFGLARLKDIAFERAIEGELVPIFKGERLLGFQRKHNNALLMFCLRQYGQDANGRRTTINYVSSKAQAGSVAGAGVGAGVHGGIAAPETGQLNVAEASTTTVRTVITGDGDARDRAERGDATALDLQGFAGIEFDEQARAEMQAVLLAHAERRRKANAIIEAGGDDGALQRAWDPQVNFVALRETDSPYLGALELPPGPQEIDDRFEGEAHWSAAGEEIPADWLEAIERMEAAKTAPQIAEVKRPKPRRRKKQAS